MLYLFFEIFTSPSLSSAQIKGMGEGVTVDMQPLCNFKPHHSFKVVGGSSNVTEPFCDSNPINEMHSCLLGLIKYAAFSCHSFYAKKGKQRAVFSCSVCIMEGKKREVSKTMPATLTLQTTHWGIPTAVNVSALSESPTNPSTTCESQPKGHGSNFVSMQISTARVCFYLCLFLLLCKVWANHVCPFSPSGSHRLNDLPMLAWSTHCDENALGSEDYHALPSWLPSIIK